MTRKNLPRSGSKDSDARYWIDKLQLRPHPEGGYFRQTYESDVLVGRRAASTAIYFLLDGENFSAFHRLHSDEIWHFYAGSPLIVHVIDPAGEYSSILLGNDPEQGEVFQEVVKAGCWFASEIAPDSHFSQRLREVGHPAYALVGCTVAPGFEFEDFELAKREALVREFPLHHAVIRRLTRE